MRSAILVVTLAACGAHPAVRLPPTDVPVTVGMANDTLRFSVSIQVGDAPPFDALLDTGSAGLQIVPGALPDSAFDSITSTPVGVIFGGTLRVDGVIALARFQIGGLATSGPIPVARIETFSCTANNLGCSPDMLQKSHFSGFAAIFGVGMRSFNSTGPIIGNPIAQLDGSPPFILQTPAFPGGTGNLRISPTDEELAAFSDVQLEAESGLAPLPNGIPSWNDEGVPSCVNDQTTATKVCGGALLDCGSPATLVETSLQTGSAADLASGDDVDVTIGTDASPPAGEYHFTVGDPPQPGQDLVVVAPGNSTKLNLGTAPFFRYDVLLDQAHGKIGLAQP